jgi:hypothetical protein
MKVLAAIALLVYFLAWWLAFWLPMRKCDVCKFLVFIPVALCSVAIPMVVSDIRSSTPTTFMVIWFVVPLILVAIMLRREKTKPKRTVPTDAQEPRQ